MSYFVLYLGIKSYKSYIFNSVLRAKSYGAVVSHNLSNQCYKIHKTHSTSCDYAAVAGVKAGSLWSQCSILQLLRLFKHDQSFALCDDLVAVLRAYFTDPVAHGMTLGATKAFYSIAFGLDPYFHEESIHGTPCWLMRQQQTRMLSNLICMLDAGAGLRKGWFASMLPLHS